MNKASILSAAAKVPLSGENEFETKHNGEASDEFKEIVEEDFEKIENNPAIKKIDEKKASYFS